MNVITIVKVLELKKGSYTSDKIFRDLGFVKQLIGGGILGVLLVFTGNLVSLGSQCVF